MSGSALSEPAMAFVERFGLKDVRQIGPMSLQMSRADHDRMMSGLAAFVPAAPTGNYPESSCGFYIFIDNSLIGTGLTKADYSEGDT